MSDKASPNRGAFLFCLSHSGNLTIAAEFAGATRADITKAMARDADFAQAVEEALCEADERLFHQAMRRALIGVAVPRFYQGEIIGHVRTPSDYMLRYVMERLATQRREAQQSQGRNADALDSVTDIETMRAKIRAKIALWAQEHDG